MSDLERMVETLFEERRLGWMTRDVSYFAPGVKIENVAAHSYFAAQAALFLAQLAADKVDVGRTVLMALFHDSLETRTGDIPRTNKRYVSKDSDKALEEKFGGWEAGALPKGLIEEFEEGKTYEAQLAQDADVAAFLISLRLLEPLGVQGVAERFDKNAQRLRTIEGKTLAQAIKTTGHMDWWYKARWG